MNTLKELISYLDKKSIDYTHNNQITSVKFGEIEIKERGYLIFITPADIGFYIKIYSPEIQTRSYGLFRTYITVEEFFCDKELKKFLLYNNFTDLSL